MDSRLEILADAIVVLNDRANHLVSVPYSL